MRDWYCIATGPSLRRDDAEKAWQAAQENGGKVIVVNDNYRLKLGDYLYACDEKWWKHHYRSVKDLFKGELWTQYHNDATKKFVDEYGLNAFEGKGQPGLGKHIIHHGSNSGFQAINLAFLLHRRDFSGDSQRIILLGYDMGRTGGKSHWFGDHPSGFTNGNHSSFIPQFTRLAEDLAKEGVEVVNCSRETKLTQFTLGDIDAYTRVHRVQRAVSGG